MHNENPELKRDLRKRIRELETEVERLRGLAEEAIDFSLHEGNCLARLAGKCNCRQARMRAALAPADAGEED